LHTLRSRFHTFLSIVFNLSYKASDIRLRVCYIVVPFLL